MNISIRSSKPAKSWKSKMHCRRLKSTGAKSYDVPVSFGSGLVVVSLLGTSPQLTWSRSSLRFRAELRTALCSSSPLGLLKHLSRGE